MRKRKKIELSRDGTPKEYEAAIALADEWGVSVDDIDYNDARWRVLNEECEQHLSDGLFYAYRQSRVKMLEQFLREDDANEPKKREAIKAIARECIYLAYAGHTSMDDQWMKTRGRTAGALNKLGSPERILDDEASLYSEIFDGPEEALSDIEESPIVSRWRDVFPLEQRELKRRLAKDWF